MRLHDDKSAHHISRKACCQRTKHLSLFLVPAPSPAPRCSFCNKSIYVHGVSQGEQTATYKPLIYIRPSLGPGMCLSRKAAAVCLAAGRQTMRSSALNRPPEKQLGGRDGSKNTTPDLPRSPSLLPSVLHSLLFSFSVFTGKCTDNKRLG